MIPGQIEERDPVLEAGLESFPASDPPAWVVTHASSPHGSDPVQSTRDNREAMMAEKIEKPAWKQFFDALSRAIEGNRAEVEVASLAIGDQRLAAWLPLVGIVYDPKDDLIEIALEGIDHLIRRPVEVMLDSSTGPLRSLQIVDAEGTHQIVKFKDPVTLPSAR